MKLTKEIQVHMAEKESITYLERGKAKSEKNLAEDALGKISVEDAVDYKIWAITVQSIKEQTSTLEPAKRKVRLKHLIFQSIEDRDLKEDIEIIDHP